MDNLTIRDFMPDDKEDYLDMSRAFYHSKAVDHDVPEAYFSATFDACMAKNPYTRGFLFLIDEKSAGYALISLTWSNEVGGMCVLLEEAFIRPGYRGKGLGTAFFAYIEAEYAGKAKRFRLEVTPVNNEAIRLYERMGFASLQYIQMIKDL